MFEVEAESGGGPELVSMVSDGCYGSTEEEDYFCCGSSESIDGYADSFEEEHGGWAGGGQVGSCIASFAYPGSYKCIAYLEARDQWDTVPDLEYYKAMGPVLVPGKAAVAFEAGIKDTF